MRMPDRLRRSPFATPAPNGLKPAEALERIAFSTHQNGRFGFLFFRMVFSIQAVPSDRAMLQSPLKLMPVEEQGTGSPVRRRPLFSYTLKAVSAR